MKVTRLVIYQHVWGELFYLRTEFYVYVRSELCEYHLKALIMKLKEITT